MSDLRQKLETAAAAIMAITPNPRGDVGITATASDELLDELVAMGGKRNQQIASSYDGSYRLITAVRVEIGTVTFSAQNGRVVNLDALPAGGA